ncbi:O-antigen ligase family protein [Noviherbaspirillum aridicola]|nr:O-antigen ligase family protein [Noviherbaspirillum aridicola]
MLNRIPGTSSSRLALSICILLALPLLMAFPRTAGSLMGVLALAGLAALATERRFRFIDWHFLAFCMILPAAYMWNMMITGWETDILDRPIHLFAGFLIYCLIGRIGLHRNTLFYAALLGAFTALGIAVYEGVYLGNARVFGLGNRWNAVPFGNFSLIVGFFCVAAAGLVPRGLEAPAPRRLHLLLSFAGVVAGLTASLLSGTRGGWVAIPLLVLLCVFLNDQLSRRSRGLALIVILGVVTVFFSTSDRMHSRVSEAQAQITQFIAAPDDPKSHAAPVGVRLGMWYWGIKKFMEHPLTGMGLSAYEEERKAAVDSGELPPDFIGYANLHNEIITSLALGGLPSALAVIAFWIIGWRFFHAHLKAGNQEEHYFALCGLLVLVGTAVFAMTEGLFGTSPGTKALVLCLAVPAGAIRYCERMRTAPVCSGSAEQQPAT